MMTSLHWIVIGLLISCVKSENDMCIGSGCTCTDYPVHIKCVKGHPEVLEKMVKRMAVTLEVNGDSLKDLMNIDLGQFVSLESFDVNIYHPSVCFWGVDKENKYPDVEFNLPSFCRYYKQEININNIFTSTVETIRTETKDPDVENQKDGIQNITYIQITPRDLLFLFIMFGFISLCGILRPYIR